MVDVSKIDEFFNGKRPFSERLNNKTSVRTRFLRIAKLIMPSVAAIIVAFIIIYPSLKNETVNITNDITRPKKNELERLHIEKTIFSLTDNQNKVSIFTADSIDETKENSELVKIINPIGTLPVGEDGEVVNIEARVGFYNQKEAHVKMQDDVKAVYTDGTTVLTQSAEYEFNKSFGYGKDDVYAFGSWGELWSQGFEYYQKEALLILMGNSKVVNEDNTITSCKQMRYYRLANKLEAEGNVKVTTLKGDLYADIIKADLKHESGFDIKQVEAFGNVKVITEDAVATGQYAIYYPDKSEIELQKNVSIEKDGNIIYGQKAITNLKTSISKMITNSKHKSRVSGIIKGSTVKRKQHEKK